MTGRTDLSQKQFLYLTTTGRATGLPREIEIWFVTIDNKFYILAEHGERAHWVRNIRANSRVRVRVGDQNFDAIARVLDGKLDRATYEQAQQLERAKYAWGDGLPVELAPLE